MALASLSDCLSGLLLAINSSRGHQVVIRYPLEPQILDCPLLRQQHLHDKPIKFAYDEVLASAAGNQVALSSNSGSNTGVHTSTATSVANSFNTLHAGGSSFHISPMLAMTTTASKSLSNGHSIQRSSTREPQHILSSERLKQSQFAADKQQEPSSSASEVGMDDDECYDCAEFKQERFLGFKNHYLGDLLTPKPIMCDRRFQLGIDNLTFIGHPVTVTPKQKLSSVINSLQTTTINSPVAIEDQYNDLLNANLEVVNRKLNGSDGNVLDVKELQSQLDVIAGGIDGVNAVTDGNEDDDSDSAPSTLSLFNVTLIIRNPGNLSGSVMCQYADKVYENVILPLSMAFKEEEYFHGFLSNETEKILGITDGFLGQNGDDTKLLAQVLEASVLARELTTMYDNLITCGIAYLKVNNEVALPLNLEKSLKHTDAYIKPFHSLLLMQSIEEILEQNGYFNQDDLKLFLQKLAITSTLQEVKRKLMWPWEHLSNLIHYMIEWKHAKLIFPLTPESKFVAATVPRRKSPEYLNFSDKMVKCEMDWSYNQNGKSKDLTNVFAKFVRVMSIGDLMKTEESRSRTLKSVSVLLKHGLILQVQTCIMLAHFVDSNVGSTATQDGDEQELENVLKKATLINNSRMAGFKRILSYCDGKTPLEEICWSEQMSSAEVEDILSTYHALLIPLSYY